MGVLNSSGCGTLFVSTAVKVVHGVLNFHNNVIFGVENESTVSLVVIYIPREAKINDPFIDIDAIP